MSPEQLGRDYFPLQAEFREDWDDLNRVIETNIQIASNLIGKDFGFNSLRVFPNGNELFQAPDSTTRYALGRVYETMGVDFDNIEESVSTIYDHRGRVRLQGTEKRTTYKSPLGIEFVEIRSVLADWQRFTAFVAVSKPRPMFRVPIFDLSQQD